MMYTISTKTAYSFSFKQSITCDILKMKTNDYFDVFVTYWCKKYINVRFILNKHLSLFWLLLSCLVHHSFFAIIFASQTHFERKFTAVSVLTKKLCKIWTHLPFVATGKYTQIHCFKNRICFVTFEYHLL